VPSLQWIKDFVPPFKKKFLFLFIYFFGSTGIWTQGLMFAGHTLLPLEPLRQPCFVMGFFEIGSQKLLDQGWFWSAILLISAARITAWATGDGLCLSSCPLFNSPARGTFLISFFVVLGFELRAYNLSHSACPFLWWVFFEIGSLELFAWGWLQTMILLTSVSWVARITGVSHRHPDGNFYYY
jgi:hypothetical protein